MKTVSKILALVFVMAIAGQLEAQQGKRGSCTNAISNLTSEQKTSMNELNVTYQKQMDDYRAERQATTDLADKNTIRGKMLSAQAEHQKSVNALLTPEQQTEYAAWQQARQSYNAAKQQGNVGGRGKGKNRGNRQGSGIQQGNDGATKCTGSFQQRGSGRGTGVCRRNS